MNLPAIDRQYFLQFLTQLLNIPSPTGFTDKAIDFVESELLQYPGITSSRIKKGGLVLKWQGEQDDHPVCIDSACGYIGCHGQRSKGKWQVEAYPNWVVLPGIPLRVKVVRCLHRMAI